MDKSPGNDPNAPGRGDAGSNPKQTQEAPAEFDFLDGADLSPIHETEEAASAAFDEPVAAAPAESAVPQKYCLVCHSLIPASARVCPVCSTKLALYEGTAHKQFWKFLVGFFLITLGCFLPWSEGYPDAGYQHLVGVFVLLAGVAGMWKMWVGLVSNKFGLAPIGWAFLIFFWALYQVLSLANSFQMLERPDPKVALEDPRVRDLRASELRDLLRASGVPRAATEEGSTAAGESAAADDKKGAKGMGAFGTALQGSLSEVFGEEGDHLYSLRRNVSRWGMGRLIVFFGSSYIIWVFFVSFFGIKKGSKDGGGGGSAKRGGARAASGSGGTRSAAKDKSAKGKDDAKDKSAGRTTRRSARGKGDDASNA